MHHLQGRKLNTISCAQMQDFIFDLLINLRFIHSTPDGEHTRITYARNLCTCVCVCVCVCVLGGVSRKLVREHQMVQGAGGVRGPWRRI